MRRNVSPIHTDTMAIRMDALADRELFPARFPGRRGGDTYAWLKLMCREKELVWSPHVGAAYHMDADDMVTHREANEAAFLAKALIMRLEVQLTPEERGWLRRAVNGKLWWSWVGNAVRGGATFHLPSRLFWRGAWLQAACFALGSLTPAPLIRWLQRRRQSS